MKQQGNDLAIILGLFAFAAVANELQQVQRKLALEQVRNNIQDLLIKKLQEENNKNRQEK